MKKLITVLALVASAAVLTAGCSSSKTTDPAVQAAIDKVNSTTTTEAPTTTTTVPVSESCSKFVAAANAWTLAQGSNYSTNGGFEKWLATQSALITLSNDWSAPSAAMFSARLALAVSGIPVQEVSDTIHYCTVG